MRDVIDLTESDKQSTPTNLPNAVQDCTDCGYPCKTMHDLELHMKNQKNEFKTSITPQQCHISIYNFTTSDEFKQHLTIKHIQYNCEQCSFQAGTKIVLSKHINVTHRKEEENQEETLKCTVRTEQFSAIWNLNNHTRDVHDIKKDCKFF